MDRLEMRPLALQDLTSRHTNPAGAPAGSAEGEREAAGEVVHVGDDDDGDGDAGGALSYMSDTGLGRYLRAAVALLRRFDVPGALQVRPI